MKNKACRKFSCETCNQIIKDIQVENEQNATNTYQTKEILSLVNKNRNLENSSLIKRPTLIGHLSAMVDIGRLEKVGSEGLPKYKMGEIYYDVRKLFKEFEKELLVYWDTPNSRHRFGNLTPNEWEKLVTQADTAFAKTKIALKQNKKIFYQMIQTSMQRHHFGNGLRYSYPDFRLIVRDRCSLCKQKLKSDEIAFLTISLELEFVLSTIAYSELIQNEFTEFSISDMESIIAKYLEDGFVDHMVDQYISSLGQFRITIKPLQVSDTQNVSSTVQRIIALVENRMKGKIKPYWVWKIKPLIKEVGYRHKNELTNYSGGYVIDSIAENLERIKSNFNLNKEFFVNFASNGGIMNKKCQYCKFPLNWCLFADEISINKIVLDSKRMFDPMWTHYQYLIKNSHSFNRVDLFDENGDFDPFTDTLEVLQHNETWHFQIPFKLYNESKFHLFCYDKIEEVGGIKDEHSK